MKIKQLSRDSHERHMLEMNKVFADRFKKITDTDKYPRIKAKAYMHCLTVEDRTHEKTTYRELKYLDLKFQNSLKRLCQKYLIDAQEVVNPKIIKRRVDFYEAEDLAQGIEDMINVRVETYGIVFPFIDGPSFKFTFTEFVNAHKRYQNDELAIGV